MAKMTAIRALDEFELAPALWFQPNTFFHFLGGRDLSDLVPAQVVGTEMKY
jgi:hypothetical protein